MLSAGLLLLTRAAPAQETVELEIDPGDRVVGTLRPATEIERFVLDVPSGAKLSALARPNGGSTLQLVLLDPEDREVARGTTRGAKTRLAATAEVSGPHRIRVSGDGDFDGDYTLRAKSAPLARFTERATADLPTGSTVDIPFSAPAGATLRATIAPTRGSGLVAADVAVLGPRGDVDVTTKTRGTKTRATTGALAATGDHILRFRNAGAEGTWKVRVDVNAGTPARRRIDVTDDALQGTFGGTQAVFGSRATPDSETIVVPAEGALNLAEMQVTVPVGAITAPTVVSIAEVEPFFVDDTTFPAGEAVRLEPSGTQFEEDVQVTLPFLAQSFDDPESELAVVRRDDETGEVEELAGPFAVDVDTGSVTFATSTFSTFQTVSRKDRPVKGTFLEIIVRPRFDDDGGSLTLATNLVHGDFGDRTENPADRTRRAHTLTWSRDAGVSVATDTGTEVGTFRIDSDESVSLVMPSGPRSFRRGRTPNALVAAGAEDGAPRLGALLRRAQGTPAPGALAGDWHAFVLEGNAIESAPGVVAVRLLLQRLRLKVAADGRASASGVVRVTVARDTADGEWTVVGDRNVPDPGSLTPSLGDGDAAFAANLDMALGRRAALVRVPLFPALSGDLLVGSAGVDEGGAGAVRLVVLVRTSSDAVTTDLTGRSIVGAAGFRTGGDPATDATVARDLDVVRTKRGAVSGAGALLVQERGAAAVTDTESFDETWKIKPNGRFREFAPLREGALTPRGELYVDVDVRDGRVEIGFGVPAAPR
jgi:hypothetical protein